MTSFQKVYEEHAQSVYRFLLSLTRNEDLAEELLSETFYQAFRHIDRFEGRCSLYTWLCQIGKNAWIKECKRKKKIYEVSLEDLKLSDDRPSPEEQVITKEMYGRILRVLQELDNPYRDVFILHAMGGVKLKEVACMFEKTESWARVTYFRAKKQILEEVSK